MAGVSFVVKDPWETPNARAQALLLCASCVASLTEQHAEITASRSGHWAFLRGTQQRHGTTAVYTLRAVSRARRLIAAFAGADRRGRVECQARHHFVCTLDTAVPGATPPGGNGRVHALPGETADGLAARVAVAALAMGSVAGFVVNAPAAGAHSGEMWAALKISVAGAALRAPWQGKALYSLTGSAKSGPPVPPAVWPIRVHTHADRAVFGGGELTVRSIASTEQYEQALAREYSDRGQ
jgi:hypothetical protein